MDRNTKKWLIIATLLVLTGVIVLLATLSLNNWDNTELNLYVNKTQTNSTNFKTTTFDVGEPFSNISVKSSASDLIFIKSSEPTTKVITYIPENLEYKVTVDENTLKIEETKDNPPHSSEILTLPLKITISSSSDSKSENGFPKITVYLPKSAYDSLHIDKTSGKINVPGIFNLKNTKIYSTSSDIEYKASTKDMIDIDITSGNIYLSDLTSSSLKISTTSGNTKIHTVNIKNDISIDSTSGDIRLEDVSFNNLNSSGVSGDILLYNIESPGSITLESTSGNINVENSKVHNIKLNTISGDINVVKNTTVSGNTQTHSISGDINIEK